MTTAPEPFRLERTSTADQAATVLRAAILGGSLLPGAPLRETELATRLDVSRNTVRETLRILAREGIVVRDGHRIATVAEVTPEAISDIFAVRMVLESGAIDLLERADERPDLSEARAACLRLAALDADVPWADVVDADRAFHAALVKLSGSPRLISLYDQIESEVRLCLTIGTRHQISIAALRVEHNELLRLLEEGDYDGFRALTATSLTNASERIKGLFARAR